MMCGRVSQSKWPLSGRDCRADSLHAGHGGQWRTRQVAATGPSGSVLADMERGA
jgi:hypothetical protein